MGCAVDHKGALAEKKDNPMKFFFFLKWEITRQGGTWGWHRWRRHHCYQCREGRSVKLWSLRGHSRWPTRSLIQMLQSSDPHKWTQIRHLRQCSLPTSTESSPQESESIPEPAWVQWILGRKLLPGSNLTPTAPDVRWKVLARKRAPYERKIRLWKLRNLWKLLWSFSWCEHVTPCWQAHNDGRLIWEIWQTWRNAVFQQNSAASCELLAPGSGNSPSLDFLPSHSSSHMWPLTCVHSFNPTCQLDSAIWSEPVRGLEHCSMSNCLLSISCHCILFLFPVWEAELFDLWTPPPRVLPGTIIPHTTIITITSLVTITITSSHKFCIVARNCWDVEEFATSFAPSVLKRDSFAVSTVLQEGF